MFFSALIDVMKWNKFKFLYKKYILPF